MEMGVTAGATLAAATRVSRWLDINVTGWLTVLLVRCGIGAKTGRIARRKQAESAVRPFPSRKDYFGADC
jgi:hypothetical protein